MIETIVATSKENEITVLHIQNHNGIFLDNEVKVLDFTIMLGGDLKNTDGEEGQFLLKICGRTGQIYMVDSFNSYTDKSFVKQGIMVAATNKSISFDFSIETEFVPSETSKIPPPIQVDFDATN